MDVKAWVVFTDDTDWRPLKILKRGFRHCFLVMHDGRAWITLDPLLNRMEIQVHHDLPPDFNFAAHWTGQGDRVVSVEIRNGSKNPNYPAPPMIFTCVEAIKRVLGIQSWRVLTPFGLYRYLCKNQERKNPRS
jgi:hypothetical protein